MDSLAVIIVIALIFIFVVVNERLSFKRREAFLRYSFKEGFGRLKEKKYDPSRFSKLNSYYDRHKKEGQLDDATWNDLSMDDIYKCIDSTISSSGEEYLYYLLRSPVADIPDSGSVNKSIDILADVMMDAANIEKRTDIQVLLYRLGNVGKYSLYDYIENLDILGERKNFRHIIFDLLYIPAIVIFFVSAPLATALLVFLMAFNIITYFRERNIIEPYIISFAYISRLIEAAERISEIELPSLDFVREDLKKGVGELKNLKRLSGIVTSGGRYSISSDPLNVLLDYVRMVFHIDIIIFNGMLRTVREKKKYAEMLITGVGVADASIAVSSFREYLNNNEGFCKPEFMEYSEPLKIENGYHPLLTDCVKNSIKADKSILITGSNASGKSTFLKMIAVNAVFAQTIMTCMANTYSAPVFKIFSSMTVKDSLKSGESYYMAEIRGIKRILDNAAGEEKGQKQKKAKVLCFIDEVLKGTNTIERIAASSQILKAMEGSGILTFAATHDTELPSILNDEYDYYHFEENMTETDISFSYKLMRGSTDRHNAIKLLEIRGFDRELTDNAGKLAERYAETGSWS